MVGNRCICPCNGAYCTEQYFLRAKIDDTHVYSGYLPLSLSVDEFNDFLDKLVSDGQRHFHLLSLEIFIVCVKD